MVGIPGNRLWPLLAAAAGLAAVALGAGAAPERPYVVELVIDPQRPGVVHAATSEGLFRSTDGGTTWSQTPSPAPSGSVVSLALAPTDPSRLYASSTKEFWRSSDGGLSWTQAARPGKRWFARSIAVRATSSEHLYAATEMFFASRDLVALYRSADGGRTWSPAARGLSRAALWALVAHPRDPKTVYAANADGLFRSRDRGDTWAKLWPRDNEIVNEVALDPATPATVYAGRPRAVHKSVDGGATWKRVLELAPGEVATSIAVDPKDHRVVIAATTRPTWGPPPPGRHGVYRSADGGLTWRHVLAGGRLGTHHASGEPAQVTSVAIDPLRPRVLVSTSWGLWRSLDAGRTWARADEGLLP